MKSKKRTGLWRESSPQIIDMMILFLLISTSFLWAENLCYENGKVELLLDYEALKRTLVFTTYEDLSGVDSVFIARHEPKWSFRRGDKILLDDVGFLNYVGMTREAGIFSAEREREIKRKRVQLFMGLPAGAVLVGAGGWWLNKARENRSSELLDYGASAVMVLSGIGIMYAVIKGYLGSIGTNYTEHKITYQQALSTVDRFNKLLKVRCRE